MSSSDEDKSNEEVRPMIAESEAGAEALGAMDKEDGPPAAKSYAERFLEMWKKHNKSTCSSQFSSQAELL